MTKYLVATGIRNFPVFADTPAAAIAALKQRIDARRSEHFNPQISMSLVEALDEGRLNFVVMDETRSTLIAGEYQGAYEETVSRRLAESLRFAIPQGLIFTTPVDSALS